MMILHYANIKLVAKPNNSKEIEIHVQIENSKQLKTFLQKKAKYLGEYHQIDTYYSPSHRNFTKIRPIKEWLRLRDSSGKYYITYKNWHYDKAGRSHYCDEYESSIQDIKQLKRIFSALDIKPIVTVNKVRKVWGYEVYEISLDEIKNLGDFVEIEYKDKKSSKKPAEITQEMVRFLKKFNVGDISRNYLGYPFQILFPKEMEYEKF